MHTTRYLGIAALSLLAACAHGSSRGPRVYTSSQVDTPAQLVACASYTPVLDQTRVRARVAVDFVVTADGSVASGTARARPTDSPTLADRATRDALSCTFKPALVRNTPVAAQTSYLFTYSDR